MSCDSRFCFNTIFCNEIIKTKDFLFRDILTFYT